MTANLYPEHEKLRSFKGEEDAVIEFFEWLNEKDYHLCKMIFTERFPTEGEWQPTGKLAQNLFRQSKDIDLNKLEAERRAMLKAAREATDAQA